MVDLYQLFRLILNRVHPVSINKKYIGKRYNKTPDILFASVCTNTIFLYFNLVNNIFNKRIKIILIEYDNTKVPSQSGEIEWHFNLIRQKNKSPWYIQGWGYGYGGI